MIELLLVRLEQLLTDDTVEILIQQLFQLLVVVFRIGSHHLRVVIDMTELCVEGGFDLCQIVLVSLIRLLSDRVPKNSFYATTTNQNFRFPPKLPSPVLAVRLLD